MYSSDDSLRTTSKGVEMQEIITALLDAIAALPKRRDSRSEPIFEPHFKLFSVVHKLVLRGEMTVSCTSLGRKSISDIDISLPKEARRSRQHLGPVRSMPLTTSRDGTHTYSKFFESSRVLISPTGTTA
jgi:hypothetical protein